MRYECVSCEKIYGDGENRLKFGFCSDCWGGHLAEQRKSRNVSITKWDALKRCHALIDPAFDAYDPARIAESAAVEMARRVRAGELAGWLDFYREIGWWCAWLTHWYRLGQSIKISST